MGLNHHDTLAAVHAFIACVAVLFLIPLALLIARFQRDKNPRWVRIHAVLNLWAGIFIVIAFGLGLASVMLNPELPPPDSSGGGGSVDGGDGSQKRRAWARGLIKMLSPRHGDGDDDDDTGDDSQFIGPEATFHHKLGLVLFILTLLQIAWGFTTRYLAHSQEQRRKKTKRTHSSTIGDDGRSITPEQSDADEDDDDADDAANGRPGRPRRRPPPRHWTQYTHIVFGLMLLLLFYIQCWNGLHTEWPAMSENGGTVPTAILVLFWVLVAAPVGPYLLHVVSKVLHKKRERIQRLPGDAHAQPALATTMTERGAVFVMEGGGGGREDVPMVERIVVGGPESTATVRLQQQQQQRRSVAEAS